MYGALRSFVQAAIHGGATSWASRQWTCAFTSSMGVSVQAASLFSAAWRDQQVGVTSLCVRAIMRSFQSPSPNPNPSVHGSCAVLRVKCGLTSKHTGIRRSSCVLSRSAFTSHALPCCCAFRLHRLPSTVRARLWSHVTGVTGHMRSFQSPNPSLSCAVSEKWQRSIAFT